MPPVNEPSHGPKSANGKPKAALSFQLPATQAAMDARIAACAGNAPAPNQKISPATTKLELMRKAAVKEPLSDEESLVLAMEQRYDKLNSLWKSAEEQVKRFMVPKEVTYLYNKYIDPNDPHAMQHHLHICEAIGWAKAKGMWRLCYGFYDEAWDQCSGEVGYDFTPILDASVEIRQACIPHFAELRKKVVEEAKQTVPQLDDAIATLAAALK